MNGSSSGEWQLWGMVVVAALSMIPIPRKWAKWNWPLLWPVPSLLLWISYERVLADAGVNIRLDMGLICILVAVPVFATVTRILWRRRNRNPDGLGGASRQLLDAARRARADDNRDS